MSLPDAPAVRQRLEYLLFTSDIPKGAAVNG
jgi:hypothetical protein